jgi:hypothetical protein
MWNLNCPWLKWSFLSLALLATVLVAKPMQAQGGPSVYVNGTEIRGYPEDWSHRHVVFSNIGAEDEALRKGEYEHWQKVVNEPRYVIQQLKKHGEMKGPAGIDAEYRSRWNAESTDLRFFGEPDGFVPMYRRMTKSNIKTDWSEALGGPGLAGGQYPAKFNLMTTTASCSDYVVFPTGAMGSTSQATIVAFNSVYSGCPLFSGGLPRVYWAYNTGTGSMATTSPTISLDGTQVAFVQTNGTTASLVLLKMAASGGTVGGPITLSSSVGVGSYRACTAPCYTSISLGANDTASAPFYVYGTTDTLYVGDDSGKVHEVTGAFLGNPMLDPSGWPATASTITPPALSSPVYDSGGSNRIFVTDAAGYLHSFTVAAPGTVTTSGRLENNTTNVFGPPVVDSSAEEVYTFIGYSGDPGNTGHPSYINIFPAAALGSAGPGVPSVSNYGTGVHFANGGANNPTTSNMRLGAFDNLYYEGTGTTGNLYVCENGVVYQVPLATVATSVVNVYSTPVTTPGTASACAPVTEFLGTKVATALSAAITTTTTTTIQVTSGTNIATNDFLQIDSEIMQVSSVVGTTLTVTRGVQGTTAATHANGAPTQDIKDWLFTAVAGGASGSATTAAGCTGACVFNYQVMGAGTTGNPTAGLNSTGGTSGIIIDTSSTAINGDEEIYYTPLGGTSAIQVSQAGLQ